MIDDSYTFRYIEECGSTMEYLLIHINITTTTNKEDANKNPTRCHVSVTPNGHVVKYAS